MKNLCFGLVTDIQYCDDEPYMNRYLKESLEKTEKVIEHFNKENLEFIINLGDIIDKEYRSYQPILSIFEKSIHSVYHVAGNHDYEIENDKKGTVPGLLNIPEEGYYDIEYEGWKFIILNGNEISNFAYPPDHTNFKIAEEWLREMEHQGRINGNFYNGGVSGEQLNWLKGKLSKADAEGQKVIICCHYPIYPEDKHNLLNDTEVIKLLNNFPNVKAWFCGHHHSGNYGKLKYCHVMNFKALVETKEELAYAIVECSENAIYIRGFGKELDRKMRIS